MSKNEAKVTKSVARKDIVRWLDFKKVNEKKREDSEDSIEELINAICDGNIIVKEDCTIEHTLIFPQGEGGMIKVLTYKPRLKMSEIEARSAKVKPGNSQEIIRAYICALTEQPSAIIKELDTEDNRISRSIASFFL